MSVPSGVLRYAGIWNASSTYTPGLFVQSSLVNNSFAVLQTVTGGADPSVALAPNWVEFPLPPSGDITSVTAGTGLIYYYKNSTISSHILQDNKPESN